MLDLTTTEGVTALDCWPAQGRFVCTCGHMFYLSDSAPYICDCGLIYRLRVVLAVETEEGDYEDA